jgi:hypothetical protein
MTEALRFRLCNFDQPARRLRRSGFALGDRPARDREIDAAAMLASLIPIVAVLYPLMRFLPVLYGWLMRRKIARLYGELRFLEDEITGGGGPTGAVQLMARSVSSRSRQISSRCRSLMKA